MSFAVLKRTSVTTRPGSRQIPFEAFHLKPDSDVSEERLNDGFSGRGPPERIIQLRRVRTVLPGRAVPRFVHLRVHSALSLLEGALPIKKLLDLAKADEQPALAIADTNNLFGAQEFSAKAWGAGIQPITACQMSVFFDDDLESGRGGEPALADLVLIAMSETGYGNLMELTSRAFSGYGNRVEAACHGRLSAVPCRGSDRSDRRLFRAGRRGVACEVARTWRAADLTRLRPVFPERCYVEIQRHGMEAERRTEAAFLELAYDGGLPIVATNEAFFPKRDDYEAHDALICISEGRVLIEDDRRRLTPEHYFKSREEMCSLFADLPEATAANRGNRASL